MRGYLLDTNMIAYWFDDKRPEHEKFVEHVNALDPDAPLRISVISLGEIEYGHRCVSANQPETQAALKIFVATKFPEVLYIRRSTSIYYGDIRSRLFNKFAPKNGKRNLRPCQLTDPLTATALGIQENDLWIAAQAMEFNLILVTHDKMKQLQEVAPDDLVFEDWTM